MKNATGTIVGAISGYYDVEIDGKIVRTRARGVFRGRKQKPLVGDKVEVQLDDRGINYLVKIFPRENEIGRPAVANVAQVLLVISAIEPDFSTELLDRYLTFFSWQGVGVEIYLSKTDLISEEKLVEIKQVLNYYKKIGYSIFLSAKELEEKLPKLVQKNEVWTLAGQSGAGKSTLLNSLKKDAKQETGEISTALNRGKHTTRKVQLFNYGEGLLADTPGFSAVDLYKIKIEQLSNYFYEFATASKGCKFRSCQHIHEPGCNVKKLVVEGEIRQSRYDDYLKIRQEIEDNRMPEYRK